MYHCLSHGTGAGTDCAERTSARVAPLGAAGCARAPQHVGALPIGEDEPHGHAGAGWAAPAAAPRHRGTAAGAASHAPSVCTVLLFTQRMTLLALSRARKKMAARAQQLRAQCASPVASTTNERRLHRTRQGGCPPAPDRQTGCRLHRRTPSRLSEKTARHVVLVRRVMVKLAAVTVRAAVRQLLHQTPPVPGCRGRANGARENPKRFRAAATSAATCGGGGGKWRRRRRQKPTFEML